MLTHDLFDDEPVSALHHHYAYHLHDLILLLLNPFFPVIIIIILFIIVTALTGVCLFVTIQFADNEEDVLGWSVTLDGANVFNVLQIQNQCIT